MNQAISKEVKESVMSKFRKDVAEAEEKKAGIKARHAIVWWLDVTDMETAVHGRRPTPDHIRTALIEEASKPSPRPVAEILAPFEAEVKALENSFHVS